MIVISSFIALHEYFSSLCCAQLAPQFHMPPMEMFKLKNENEMKTLI